MMTSALRVEKSASTYFSLRKLEKSDRVKQTRRRYQRNSPWVLRFQSLVFKKGGYAATPVHATIICSDQGGALLLARDLLWPVFRPLCTPN
jgi:hypothetical protein